MYLGPTQLGKRLGLTAREVNKLLEQKGYQIKTIGIPIVHDTFVKTSKFYAFVFILEILR